MKIKYLGIIVSIALFIFIINGCEHKPKEFITPGNKDTTAIIPNPTSNCDPDTVYFQNTILPLIVANCNGAGCHNAKDQANNVILDNYSNIKIYVKAGNLGGSKLYDVITKTDPGDVMPRSGKMPQATIDLIAKWIQQGALNNYCNSGCDSTKFAYALDISKIIDANCMGCHNTGATKLGTYSDLKAVGSNNKLMNSINHIGSFPMPSPTVKLSSCDINKIQKWITSGYPQ